MAVTVDQQDDGEFTWKILESPSKDSSFATLAEGALGFDTYVDALQAGCETLVALCVDPLIGPVQYEDDRRQ